MDKYKTENNSFFTEALEHGFTMVDAALGRRRCWERERRSKGRGPHRHGKDNRRRLLGGAHVAAQGGAAWGPHYGSGHRQLDKAVDGC
jgi:hypothetical protein